MKILLIFAIVFCAISVQAEIVIIDNPCQGPSPTRDCTLYDRVRNVNLVLEDYEACMVTILNPDNLINYVVGTPILIKVDCMDSFIDNPLPYYPIEK